MDLYSIARTVGVNFNVHFVFFIVYILIRDFNLLTYVLLDFNQIHIV